MIIKNKRKIPFLEFLTLTLQILFITLDVVFKYPTGVHNVYKVNGTDFQKCTIPGSSIALDSGYDVVTLTTPGRKWYICGVGKHCEMGGMKLVITVLSQSTFSPSPTPWSSSKGARRLGGVMA